MHIRALTGSQKLLSLQAQGTLEASQGWLCSRGCPACHDEHAILHSGLAQETAVCPVHCCFEEAQIVHPLVPRLTEALAGILSALVPRARIVPAVPPEYLSKDPQVVRPLASVLSCVVLSCVVPLRFEVVVINQPCLTAQQLIS